MTEETDGTKHGSCDKSWGSRSTLGLALLSFVFWLALNHSILLAQSCCQEVVLSGGQLVPRSGTDTEPPQPPTGFSTLTQTGATIKIGWQVAVDNVAATGYQIFRNGTQVGSSTTLNYTDSGLQPNTSYTYTVKAYDAANNLSAASAPYTASTVNDTSPPTAPTGLVSTNKSRTSIWLSWNASTDDVGVDHYDLYRNGSCVWHVSGLNKTDSGLSPGTSYQYYVKAVDAAGNQSSKSNTITVTTNP